MYIALIGDIASNASAHKSSKARRKSETARFIFLNSPGKFGRHSREKQPFFTDILLPGAKRRPEEFPGVKVPLSLWFAAIVTDFLATCQVPVAVLSSGKRRLWQSDPLFGGVPLTTVDYFR